jgi:hypothetical protein
MFDKLFRFTRVSSTTRTHKGSWFTESLGTFSSSSPSTAAMLPIELFGP